MGYGDQERKWWGCRIGTVFGGNRRFSRLSSSEIEPLLDDFCEKLEFEKYYTGDVEDIRKRNCELERMLDEMRRKMDELTKEVTNTKNEVHDKIEKDKMERRTTSSNSKAEITKIKERVTTLEGKSIKKIKDTKKIVEMEKRNVAFEGEIKKLKDRVIYLEVNSIQNKPVENTSSALVSGLDQIEEMEIPASHDELFLWIIILAFFVGFLIGMQL